MTSATKIGSTISLVIGLVTAVQLLFNPFVRTFEKLSDIYHAPARIKLLQMELDSFESKTSGSFSELYSWQEMTYKDLGDTEKKVFLLNKGKPPYDTIYLVSKSGHLYKTHIDFEIK